jgi:hypothetical protein
VAELRVGFDGEAPRSLGRSDERDPWSGKPAAERQLVVAGAATREERAYPVVVEIVRIDGSVEGPHALTFSPREERLAAAKLAVDRAPRTLVSFAEHGSVYTWLGFHRLLALGDAVGEVRYSIDDCSLRHRLVPGKDGGEPIADRIGEDPADLTAERPFLTLRRATTESACVQVVFADGTRSAVVEVVRPLAERSEGD